MLTKVTVAYKVLVCVHNLVQEGHPACLVDAHRQRHLFVSMCEHYGANRVAYSQLVTQYATYMLAKLDFHTEHKEWICDKEGNLDWDYFLERYPGRFGSAAPRGPSPLFFQQTAATLIMCWAWCRSWPTC